MSEGIMTNFYVKWNIIGKSWHQKWFNSEHLELVSVL